MADTIKFSLGDIVYHVLEQDKAGVVTGIMYRPIGVIYYITWKKDASECSHYDVELSSERKFVEPTNK